jgi:hypothetical protein
MRDTQKRKRISFFLSLILALVAVASDAAASESKAADWMFHAIVDVNFVKQYAKVPQPEGVLIVDSRPYKPKYVNGHIPTAVSIPDSQFEKMIDKLPKDKNALLIFYCEGVK